VVPLTPSPHPVDDRVQSSASVYPLAPRLLGWIALSQYRLDSRPQLVRCVPDSAAYAR